MRRSHRRSAQEAVAAVAAARARTNTYSGRRNVWLEQAGTVVGAGAAAAKVRQRVIDIDRADRKGGAIDGRRILYRRAGRSGITRRDLDKNAGCLRVVDDRL